MPFFWDVSVENGSGSNFQRPFEISRWWLTKAFGGSDPHTRKATGIWLGKHHPKMIKNAGWDKTALLQLHR